MARTWRIVGGIEKGGIVVRVGEELKSRQTQARLSTESLVEEVEVRGARLHFRLLNGCGPPRGWISIQVGRKELATPLDRLEAEYQSVVIHLGDGKLQRVPVSSATSINDLKLLLLQHPTWPFQEDPSFKALGDTRVLSNSDIAKGELELVRNWHAAVRAALRPDATEERASEALRVLRAEAASGLVHLARGLIFWRWYKLDSGLAELEAATRQGCEAAGYALLALQICLGRWPEAKELAGRSPEAAALIDAWSTGNSGHFSPSAAKFAPESVELRPGLRQIDARMPTVDEVCLGVRLFLRVHDGAACVSQPLVLYFHGNAETVDTYKDPEVFEPLEAAAASALVVDFRGYGYSTWGGGPSLAWMNVDAERVCDGLPEFFASRGLPWPWPGGLTLFGRSMGGIIACHLAGLRGELFRGVVLESTMCGSHAPGAQPPPEPPQDGGLGGLQGLGGSRFAPAELTAAVAQSSELCRSLLTAPSAPAARGDLQELLGTDPTQLVFAHVMASEDKLRGFAGRLLILHGEIDTLIPVGHARRLCDAAVSATRRLVTVGKGHNDISFSAKYVEALKQFLSGQ